MKVTHTHQSVRFEWDDVKAQTNLRKHGVSFESACQAFFDPFVRWIQEEVVHGELRETMIGMTEDWKLLFTVYVMRENSIRLISAREVTHTERKLYEDQ